MKRPAVLCAAVLLCVLLYSRCTLIGYGIGSAIDHSGEGTLVPAPPQMLDQLEPGDSTVLVMRDGTAYRGLFMDRPASNSDSILVWAENTDVPDCDQRTQLRVGDRITLHRTVGDSLDVVYLGAYQYGLYYRLPDERAVTTMRYTHVTGIRWCRGTRWFASPVSNSYKLGLMERQESVRILTDTGLLEVRGSQIAKILHIEHTTVGRWIGGLLGASVDLMALMIVAIADDLSSGRSSSSRRDDRNDNSGGWQSGCPFILGETPAGWRIEVECLSGSFFRAAQRRDVARLEHAGLENGRLRLRVADLLQEVDSIDQITLLCAEHAAGTALYPTEEGRLIAAIPAPPIAARSDRGADILPQIRAADGGCWAVLPDADSTRWGVRRWMECVFPPPAADSVTLILRVRNTDWGAAMQYGFFALFGSGLQSYYDACNGDPAAREQLRAVMRREGMLQVRMWDGKSWRHAAWVWEVGVGAFRAVALRLSVQDLPPGNLLLRLEAPAGIWMVGSVAVDDCERGDVHVRRIAPSAATRLGGEDCRAKLLQEDGDYLALDTGEWADVEFAPSLPETTPGRTVSWLVETAGYYRTKIDATHPPRIEEIARMMNEPGHFARNADAAFHRALERMAEK